MKEQKKKIIGNREQNNGLFSCTRALVLLLSKIPKPCQKF